MYMYAYFGQLHSVPTHCAGCAAVGTFGSIDLDYVPDGALPTDGSAGTCNSYLPNESTLARFLWVRPTPACAPSRLCCLLHCEFVSEYPSAALQIH